MDQIQECGAVVLRWSSHPRCVGMARTELREALAGWGLAALEDPAALVLTELLTNAGQHARVPRGREIETRFLRVPGGLRIEVHDASSERPRRRSSEADACDGRGLMLVAALADRWGVAERGGPGKQVWAELSLTPAPDGGLPPAEEPPRAERPLAERPLAAPAPPTGSH
ncbi:ATP-binding protein [Streptomyces sp. NPDC051569]|uniref:ATP-binding protein n=1 Tax=Streptomyces sp. NPDC051569 TaxID=3365661 RepID=UPI003792D02C